MSVGMYINSIVAIFISLWCYDWYYNKMMYKKIQITVEKNLIYLLTAILAIILEENGSFLVKQIVMIIMYFIPIFNYKINFKDKLFYVISSFILLALCDQITNISSLLILKFINYKFVLSINLSESIIYYIVMTYLILIIYILVFNYKKYIAIVNRIKMMIFNNYKIILYLCPLIAIIYFLISYDFFQNIDFNGRMIVLIIGIVLCMIIIELIISYSKYKNYEKYSNNLFINIEGNNKIISQYRIEKHNLNNFLLSLKTESKENIDKIIDEYLEKNNINMNNNTIFDISSNISGFLTNKMNQYKCNYSISGVENLNTIKANNLKIYNDVCNAIGITLDNAYDAIKNRRIKEIIINIEKIKGKTIIQICNNFDNSIDINQLGHLFYTTKENGNGIGLFSVYKSKNIKYKISIINNMFKIYLII